MTLLPCSFGILVCMCLAGVGCGFSLSKHDSCGPRGLALNAVDDSVEPRPTPADLFLESYCDKGRGCTCVGADARVLPGGRRPDGKPGLSHIDPLAFLDPKGTQLTFGRKDAVGKLVDALRERSENPDDANDRGTRASRLPAILAHPGSGKSHLLVDLTRLAFTRLFQGEEAPLGDDAVVSAFTMSGSMPVQERDSIFARMAYGSMQMMGPKAERDAAMQWGRTDEDFYLGGVEDNSEREVPTNVWPTCEHEKHSGGFLPVLSEYTALRKKHCVDDPDASESGDLLLEMYERPSANLLVLADELSKAKGTSIEAAAFSLVSLLVDRQNYVIVSALSPKDDPVLMATDRQRGVICVHLPPLEARAAKKLVEVCEGGLDPGFVSVDVVSSALTFAAGNPRLLRAVYKLPKKKVAEGGLRDLQGYKFVKFQDFFNELVVEVGGAPVPLTTSTGAVARVLGSLPLEISDAVASWASKGWEPEIDLIARGDLAAFPTAAKKGVVRLDVYPYALLRFLRNGAEATRELEGLREAPPSSQSAGCDAALLLVEMMEDTFVYDKTNRPLAEPSERVACFSVLLGCSRGGRFAVDVLGETVAAKLGLDGRRARVPWSNIDFVSSEDFREEEGVARGESFDEAKAAFFRAIERRARDPELADRMIALESPPDFPAFDFVLVHKGLAFGFSVKSDPQRWLCPTASLKKDGTQQPQLGKGESQEFDELQKLLVSKNLNYDLVEDFRQLDKLRLCVKAYTMNRDFLKEEQQHAGFSLSGVGAVFGFDVDDDVRDRFKQIMNDVDLPDNYVGQEALRDSVPGGLLVFSALSRSVWGG